jgi:hypothetical protein
LREGVANSSEGRAGQGRQELEAVGQSMVGKVRRGR